MAFAVPIIAAVSGAMGIASTAKSLFSSKKGQQQQAAPVAAAPAIEKPKEEDAAAKAKAESLRRRRISVLSGGETDVTKGKSLLPASAVGKKSLLGG